MAVKELKCTNIYLQGTVYMYYGLTNFYQNHRRYVRSRDDNQLHGDAISPDNLQDDCAPYKKRKINASVEYGIAPCGAIANSLFNGKIILCVINRFWECCYGLPLKLVVLRFYGPVNPVGSC